MTAGTSSWRPCRLDELGTIGRGKSRHRPRNDAQLYGGPHPFIQTADVMSADPYISSYTQTYTDFGLQQSKMWPPETLCMTIAGANTAKTAILKIPACFPDSVVGFIPDKAKGDLHFVKYSLDLLRDRFLSVSRGATQDNLSLDKILSFPILAPPIEEQRRIGAVLAGYDESIDNSRRRIRILEAMTRSIYREWFVHFRFPGHEDIRRVPSALGEIPEGWQVAKLGNLLTLDKGVSYNGAGLTVDGNPMVNLKNIVPGGGFRRDATKPYSGDFKPRHTVRPGDVVLANTDLTQAGNVVASPAIVPRLHDAEHILISHHLFAVRLIENASRLFIYHLMLADGFRGFAKGFAIGTTVLGLPREGVINYSFAFPPQALIRLFVETVSPMHLFIESLYDRIDALSQLRDMLLPRLISGKMQLRAD
jgi:type I restriction enzyme S subunit